METRIMITAMLSFLFLAPLVLAQETELPQSGILPDNFLYPVKRFVERVHVFLTFDSEAKARVRLHYAEVRLAELNETIARGKMEFVRQLMEDYENDVDEAEKEINASVALGRNVTALAEHVGNRTYKHILVLERVLAKAPEQAKPAIEHAINASMRGHETAVVRIAERINRTAEEVAKASCATDADCRQFVCPMVLGSDTPICSEGKCECGGRWEVTNKTEWRERFGEELTNETQSVVESIRETYVRSEVGERIRESIANPVAAPTVSGGRGR